MCGRVTAGLLAGVSPGRDAKDMARWLDTRSRGEQRLIVGTTIGLKFCAAVVMAQFGWIGLAVYFVLVMILARRNPLRQPVARESPRCCMRRPNSPHTIVSN